MRSAVNFLAFASLVLFAVAGVLAVRTLPYAQGEHAQGVVTGFANSDRPATDTGSTPEVIFRDGDGQEHEFQGGGSDWFGSIDVGDDVGVRYVADDPERARIDTLPEMWGLAAIFVAIGVALLAFALWLARVSGGRPFSRRRGPDWWRSHGTRVGTAVVSVAPNTRIAVGGASPTRVVVRGADPRTSSDRTWELPMVWDVPGSLVPGAHIDLYVLGRSSRARFLDLESVTPNFERARNRTS